MHETCSGDKIIVTESSETNFEYKRVTWGLFDIPTAVHFVPALGIEPLKITHELSFTNSSSSNIYSVQVNKRKLL